MWTVITIVGTALIVSALIKYGSKRR